MFVTPFVCCSCVRVFFMGCLGYFVQWYENIVEMSLKMCLYFQ